MDAAAVRRFSRQIALPEIGPDGQQRLGAARVAVVDSSGGGADLSAETAARYLTAAGVGCLRLIGGDPAWDAALRASNPDVSIEHRARPTDGAGWLEVLGGVALVVRAGFDDDPMLRAAIRLGVPAIVMRGRPDGDAVELVSFRKHGPCPHTAMDVPVQAATAAPAGAVDVVAGTLAAAEALHTLLGNGGAARARHLLMPLDGRDATAQEIPWTPECFACGGSGSEMAFT
jgi:hypothetical protein